MFDREKFLPSPLLSLRHMKPRLSRRGFFICTKKAGSVRNQLF
ncbi:hypothetical protein HS9_00966 [Bacillus velezensis]|nr:hypothetical protein HS9_00966 [Bacillus velezensis]